MPKAQYVEHKNPGVPIAVSEEDVSAVRKELVVYRNRQIATVLEGLDPVVGYDYFPEFIEVKEDGSGTWIVDKVIDLTIDQLRSIITLVENHIALKKPNDGRADRPPGHR